jgi:hypothetical protein
MSVTLANCEKTANQLSKDVKYMIQHLKENPPAKSSTGALYGATASLPS